MKIKLIILTLLLLPFAGWSQNDTINQTDSQGQKQGYWIYLGKDRPEAKYPREGKIEEGLYVDNNKEGVWKRYYNDGVRIKVKGVYKNNKPSGAYTKYYPDGTMREQGIYIKSNYEGFLVRYHENGQVKSCEKYGDNEQKIDTGFYYYPNGCYKWISVYDTTSYKIHTKQYSQENCNFETRSEWSFMQGADTNLSVIGNEPSGYDLMKPEIRFNTLRYNPEWNQGQYADSELCQENGEIKKYNGNKDFLFVGTCQDEKIWKSKMYFYDDDGILTKVEIWKRGEYIGIAKFP